MKTIIVILLFLGLILSGPTTCVLLGGMKLIPDKENSKDVKDVKTNVLMLKITLVVVTIVLLTSIILLGYE